MIVLPDDHVTAPAGVEEGLKALQAGGMLPRFVIIDDGWQCTDVDERLQPLKTPEDAARIQAEIDVRKTPRPMLSGGVRFEF